jgi:hypothetical protein
MPLRTWPIQTSPGGLKSGSFFYNWQRSHTSLNGLTPMERCCALLPQTPDTEEIYTQYAPTAERYQEQNYYLDRQLRGLKTISLIFTYNLGGCAWRCAHILPPGHIYQTSSSN